MQIDMLYKYKSGLYGYIVASAHYVYHTFFGKFEG